MTDEELMLQLKAMEDRLVGIVNQQTERILDRLTTLETGLRNLRSEHETTRELVAALPATVLRAVERPMLNRFTALETRIDTLERK